jgi:hypothetical protein
MCVLFMEVGIKFLSIKSYIRLFQNTIRSAVLCFLITGVMSATWSQCLIFVGDGNRYLLKVLGGAK